MGRVDIIPELIEKTELSQLFSELRIPSILEVLELFQWKAELRVLVGVDIENPNFSKILLFIQIIPELDVKVLVSLFRQVLELGSPFLTFCVL